MWQSYAAVPYLNLPLSPLSPLLSFPSVLASLPSTRPAPSTCLSLHLTSPLLPYLPLSPPLNSRPPRLPPPLPPPQPTEICKRITHPDMKVVYSPTLSPPTASFIKRLLRRKWSTRLGGDTSAAVFAHAWFEGFDWDALARRDPSLWAAASPIPRDTQPHAPPLRTSSTVTTSPSSTTASSSLLTSSPISQSESAPNQSASASGSNTDSSHAAAKAGSSTIVGTAVTAVKVGSRVGSPSSLRVSCEAMQRGDDTAGNNQSMIESIGNQSVNQPMSEPAGNLSVSQSLTSRASCVAKVPEAASASVAAACTAEAITTSPAELYAAQTSAAAHTARLLPATMEVAANTSVAAANTSASAISASASSVGDTAAADAAAVATPTCHFGSPALASDQSLHHPSLPPVTAPSLSINLPLMMLPSSGAPSLVAPSIAPPSSSGEPINQPINPGGSPPLSQSARRKGSLGYGPYCTLTRGYFSMV